MNIIGTCSLCGGAVEVPMHMVNPVPMCRSCGAIPKAPHGPVIEMERPIRSYVHGYQCMKQAGGPCSSEPMPAGCFVTR